MNFETYRDRWKNPDYRTLVRQKAKGLKSDGCSGVLDFHRDGCLEHDIAYRTGKDPLGEAISRAEADKRLRWYIQIHSRFGGASPMAWWRWAGVRLLGRKSWDVLPLLLVALAYFVLCALPARAGDVKPPGTGDLTDIAGTANEVCVTNGAGPSPTLALCPTVTISRNRPHLTLDATEAVGGGFIADRNVYLINRNANNGGTGNYFLQAGLSWNCDWDGVNWTVRTGNRCITFGMGGSGDLTMHYSSTGAIGGLKTDADFTRCMEFFDAAIISIIFDCPFQLNSSLQRTGAGLTLGKWFWEDTGGNPLITIFGDLNPGRVALNARWDETGDISPAQIIADQNDYNPTSLALSSVLRLSTDASRTITGLAGGADGRRITIHNVGAQPIVLSNQNALSALANRFLFGGDITLAADQSIALYYDATTSRWRAVTSVGSSAKALMANGANCAAGNYPLGVDASGAVEGCTAAGGGSEPDPATSFSISDEFASGATLSSGQIGSLGWMSGGCTSSVSAEANRPGIVRLDTGATANAQCAMWARQSAGSGIVQGASLFDALWYARLNTNDANTLIRIGMSGNCGAGTFEVAYFEKLAADTTWFRVTRLDATETRINTTIAIGTAWVKMRIRRIDATTIGFTIDANAEQTNITNTPAGALQPCIYLDNNIAAAKTADVDYFRLKLAVTR